MYKFIIDLLTAERRNISFFISNALPAYYRNKPASVVHVMLFMSHEFNLQLCQDKIHYITVDRIIQVLCVKRNQSRR